MHHLTTCTTQDKHQKYRLHSFARLEDTAQQCPIRISLNRQGPSPFSGFMFESHP